MKVASLIAALILIGSSAQAMNLAEMRKMALSNRAVVEQFIANLEQSEQEIVRTRSALYPSADLSYGVNLLDEAAMLEAKENSALQAKISWNLFAGFRDKYGVQTAELLRQIEEYKLQGLRQDVQLSVALAYLAVFERRANKEVADSAFQTLAKVYRDGESRYQVGLIGKNELLKFRVDYDNADITAKSADGGLKKSINDLSRQVGVAINYAALDFSDFDQQPPLVDRSASAAKMLAERSEIKALEMAIAATTAQIEAARSGYYPRVDAVGSYRRVDDALVGDASAADEEWRAQMVLSVNLYQGRATEAAVAKSRLQLRAQQQELQELKESLGNDLDNLFIDLQVSLDNIPVAKRSIESAEENLRITELKYQEGLQRESDLLDAITSLSRAQYNYVAVLRTMFTNYFRILRMVGGF
jgi:outer membrane protein TolC